jgi:hypothetical protein
MSKVSATLELVREPCRTRMLDGVSVGRGVGARPVGDGRGDGLGVGVGEGSMVRAAVGDGVTVGTPVAGGAGVGLGHAVGAGLSPGRRDSDGFVRVGQGDADSVAGGPVWSTWLHEAATTAMDSSRAAYRAGPRDRSAGTCGIVLDSAA